MILFIEIFLIVLAIFIFLMGYKIKRNKWLRLIAGNTFNNSPKEASDIAPFVRGLLYVVSIFILITAVATLYLYII